VRDTAPVDGVLCPIVVGRDTELATLVELVGAAAAGSGRLVCLVGEAGVGKSRLVRELTVHAGGRQMMVLSGRAVPGASPLPFRPLNEVLLVAGRAGGPPQARELAGFGGQLARLVPDWGVAAPGGADESPVLVGEAVLRLLRVLGRAGPHAGCLLVLEDMH
jgi:predicted ATPase